MHIQLLMRNELAVDVVDYLDEHQIYFDLFFVKLGSIGPPPHRYVTDERRHLLPAAEP